MMKPTANPEIVLYDIDMLISLMTDWPTWPTLDRVTRNAMLEATLVHTRVLSDFFENRGNGDDVKVREFDFVAVESSPVLGRAVRDRVNKRLMHISAQRETLDRNWRRSCFLQLVSRCRAYLDWMSDKGHQMVGLRESADKLVRALQAESSSHATTTTSPEVSYFPAKPGGRISTC